MAVMSLTHNSLVVLTFSHQWRYCRNVLELKKSFIPVLRKKLDKLRARGNNTAPIKYTHNMKKRSLIALFSLAICAFSGATTRGQDELISKEVASTVAKVSLPEKSVDKSATNFVAPVITTAIDGKNNLVGFQGDFTFDSSIVTFQNPPISGSGLTGTNWNVTGNVIGAGTIKTLRISAFSNDFTPLSGSGTLFQLNLTRVSSTPGANTPLIWAAPPDDFYFIDADLNNRSPSSTPSGSLTIQGATINISGTMTYCSNPTLPPVANATLTLTGDASGSTVSNGSGNYTLASIPSGGNYTVTPSKAALTPGSTGIDTVDVVAIQRHFLVLGVPLSGCRLTAADVNGLAGVDTVDVIATQRFFLEFSTGIANVGKYNFSPANRTYAAPVTDQTAQNYNTLAFGDVVTGFVH
jgi:hypothetical protein